MPDLRCDRENPRGGVSDDEDRRGMALGVHMVRHPGCDCGKYGERAGL